MINYKSGKEYLGLRYPAFSMSWLEAVIFCNKLSQIDGFEMVYEIPEGAEVLSRKVYKATDDEVDACVAKITMNLEANGYRLPFEHEWEYAARGGEEHILLPVVMSTTTLLGVVTIARATACGSSQTQWLWFV